jgi:hypothetical protein
MALHLAVRVLPPRAPLCVPVGIVDGGACSCADGVGERGRRGRVDGDAGEQAQRRNSVTAAQPRVGDGAEERRLPCQVDGLRKCSLAVGMVSGGEQSGAELDEQAMRQELEERGRGHHTSKAATPAGETGPANLPQ